MAGAWANGRLPGERFWLDEVAAAEGACEAAFSAFEAVAWEVAALSSVATVGGDAVTAFAGMATILMGAGWGWLIRRFCQAASPHQIKSE